MAAENTNQSALTPLVFLNTSPRPGPATKNELVTLSIGQTVGQSISQSMTYCFAVKC